MPSVGDIIQITDVQSFLGQEVLNVYHYRVDEFGSAASVEEAVNAWQTHVQSVVKTVQVSSLVHTRTIWKNLSDGIEIYEEPHTVPGTHGTGESLPSFVAWAFRLIRTTGLTRHGQKRIAGIIETAIDGNTPTAGTITGLNTVAAALGSPVVVDTSTDEDLTLQPVIVGRTLTVVDGKDTWPLDLTKINDVASAQYIRVSSQTTRRAGRGV